MINTVALRFGATLKSTINESDSVVLIVERREGNHFVSMHDPRLKHRLHRIDVPTLLIWGESDGLVTTDYAKAYRDLIPGAELEIIAGAGHVPQAEQPKAFVEHVIKFAFGEVTGT